MMRNFLLQVFTWWRGQTLGTRLYTWRKGHYVGSDETGNQYYRNADDTRRWVIYADLVEASQIPAGWHGWIHHKVKIAPSEKEYKPHAWELPHRANPTGTAASYRPKAAQMGARADTKAGADYEPWAP